jgi:hypothetical protein
MAEGEREAIRVKLETTGEWLTLGALRELEKRAEAGDAEAQAELDAALVLGYANSAATPIPRIADRVPVAPLIPSRNCHPEKVGAGLFAQPGLPLPTEVQAP